MLFRVEVSIPQSTTVPKAMRKKIDWYGHIIQKLKKKKKKNFTQQ